MTVITLFKSITLFCGIDIILWNILHIWIECAVPQNIVMDLNNFMEFH